MDIILGLVIIGIQVLSYSIGIFVLFGDKARNIKRSVIVTLLCLVVYYVLSPGKGKMLYLDISAIVVLWALLEGTLKNRLILTLKGVFFILCVEELLEAIYSLVMIQILNNKVFSEFKVIVANMLLLFVSGIVYIIKKKKVKWPKKYTNKIILIAMGIMAADMAFVTAGIQFAEPYVNSRDFSVISNVVSIISYFGIVTFGLFILYIKHANENYKELLETESLLRKLQISNYELMLSKDEETRAFRHDLTNHIMCLKNMMQDKNLNGANRYIEELNTQLSQIQKKTYATGNEIIDAVLNYYVQQLSENTEVTVAGVCCTGLAMKDVELCSVIANPIQNAVEALNSQKQDEKYLSVKMNATKHNFKIEICNSVADNPTMSKEGLPVTAKQDKENHGFGLKNVKTLVEKYKGQFQIDTTLKEFKITVILPVIN